LERGKTYEVDPPEVVITNLEDDVETAIRKELPNSLHLVSQYYVMSKIKELLKKHQKRPDFDRLAALDKIEDIIKETDSNSLEDKMKEFLKLISFDSIAERIVGNIFSKDKKWSLVNFKSNYTAGLHTYERADAVESFNRTLKYDHTLLNIIELNSAKLETRDCILPCNSKEAHAYMEHPVYQAIAKNFSLYATSIMMHQLIASFQYISQPESESTFKVTSPSSSPFIVSLSIHHLSSPIPSAQQCLSCSCPFYSTTMMACSHIFCVMTLLQIKNINYFAHLSRWRGSSADPDAVEMAADRYLNFSEQLEEAKRRKRTKHKGGRVPMRPRKQQPFYDEKRGVDGRVVEVVEGEGEEGVDEDMLGGFDEDLLGASEEKIEGIDFLRGDESESDSSDGEERRKKKGKIRGKNLEEKQRNIRPKADLMLEMKVKDAPKRKTRRDAKKEEEELSVENNSLLQ
jgi:hypothetical protein